MIFSCTKKWIKAFMIVGLLFNNHFLAAQSGKDGAPETFKFDAVQISNLVNQSTGDFNYTVPVLNIPGPEGGYNVRLTYNAGIGMEQDASWVGLGWNVSAGAIMRTVNGSPDDCKNYEIKPQLYNRETIVNPTSIHAIQNLLFLNFAWNKQNGSFDKMNWKQWHFKFSYSNKPEVWKHLVAQQIIIGLDNGIQNIKQRGYPQTVGIGNNGGNTDFFSIKFPKYSISSTGGDFVYDQNTLFYDIGHISNYTWELFGNQNKYISGALNLGYAQHSDIASGGETWGRQSYNYSMDMYTNATSNDGSVVANNNLSFPAYDDYTVSADGLFGKFSPVTLKDGTLVGEGNNQGNEHYQYMFENGNTDELFANAQSVPNANDDKISFLFRGQHPTIKNKPGNFNIHYGVNYVKANPGPLEYTDGYCLTSKQVIGGKNIVPTYSNTDGSISGFTITNEEGLTYTFDKPVYQYERVSSSFAINNSNFINENRMINKYAYAWMLTSIKGSDYKDNGDSGIDDADEGYWVKFNYGKWSDGFLWKTPYNTVEKAISEEDKNLGHYEWGIKQLAYLNSIETRTHKAYFIKFVREDGMGSDFNINSTLNFTQPTAMTIKEGVSACGLSKVEYYMPQCCNFIWGPQTYESTKANAALPPLSAWLDRYSIRTVQEPLGNTTVPYQMGTYYDFKDVALSGGGIVGADAGSSTSTLLLNSGRQKVLGLKKIILIKKEIGVAEPISLHGSNAIYSNGISSSDAVRYKLSSTILNPTIEGRKLFESCNPIYSAFPVANAYIKATTNGTCDVISALDDSDPLYNIGQNAITTIQQIDYDSQIRRKYYGEEVYDIYDLANSTLESKALQVVEFNYDYNLCKSAPNSTLLDGIHHNGKLTLNSLDIKGADGNKVAPSFKFSYGLNPFFEELNIGTPAAPNMLKMQDDWGYRISTTANLNDIVNKDNLNKNLASAWSLTEVQTPLGGKIKVQYESDSYIKEAATSKTFDSQIKSFDVNNSSNCRNTMTIPIQLGFGTTPIFVANNQYQIRLFSVKSFSCPYCSNQNPVLTGKFLSSTSSGGTMYARFEIVTGWNADYDFSQISGNYIVDGNNANLAFTTVSNKNECNSIKIKYQSGVNVASAFIVNNNYTISLYGDNLSVWAPSIYNSTIPLVLTNAVVQSINIATNEVVFLLGNYDINYTNSLTLNTYSFSTSESNGRELYGGGLRVKELIMEDENNNQYKTVYEYRNGVTSYAPGNVFRKDIKYIAELPGPEVIYGSVIEKNIGANNIENSITEYSFETMNSNIEGSELSYGDQLYIENSESPDASYNNGYDHINFQTRIGTIHNNTGRIGRINSITHKNKGGIVLSSEKYNYYPKEYASSGVAQESFHERKRKVTAIWPEYYSDWYLTYSSRIFYPSELASVEQQKNNLSTYKKFGVLNTNNSIITNGGFDLYTHQPLITETKKETGEIYMEKTIPAYTNTNYSQLFSKTCDGTNKNILSASSANYSYIVNDQGVESLLGATAQTFKNTWDYRTYKTSSNSYTNSSITDFWRKDKAYVWKSLNNPDGTALTFTDFNWGSGAVNPNWQNSGEPTLFNHFSKGLEMNDINSKFSSVKMGYNNAYVIASATNSNYTSFAYSGAEDIAPGAASDYFGGEVLGAGSQLQSNIYSHTGNYCVAVDPGDVGFMYNGPIAHFDFQKGKKMRASVWLYSTQANKGRLSYNLIKADGSSDGSGYVDITSASTKTAGDWYLLTLDFDIPVNTTATKLSVFTSRIAQTFSSLPIYFDDFRVHPQEAVMTSTVYDETTGWVKAVLDADNFATKFTYDAAGRLIRTDKETLQGFKKVSENTYHYGRP